MSYPIKLVKFFTPIALAISLAACGGDVSFGSNGGTTTTTEDTVVGSINLSSSATDLASDGLLPIILKAVAKDTNNNVITDASIQFSVVGDSEATILETGTGVTTVAELTPGIPTNRTLLIKAESGGFSKNINVNVVGTNVVIDGPDAVGFGTDSSFLLKLKNSGNKAIAGAEVTLSSEKSNTISFSTNITNSNGEIPFTLSAVNSGVDKITVNASGALFTKTVTISADEFVLSGSNQDIVINTNEVINFVWKKNGVAQANQTIEIVATRGTVPNTVTTNASGTASFTINSATAGETIISVTNTATGLSASMVREFVATNARNLNTQAAPAFIFPNGSSTILAKVTDDNANPVKGKVVEFSLVTDTVNGRLSSATAVTDALGRASVAYTAGNASSGANGVEITSTVRDNAAIPADNVFITVGGEATRISLGHDNLVGKENTNYVKQFSVIVTDTGGSPVAGQAVSFTIRPTEYLKGMMVVGGDKWVRAAVAVCASEDLDADGTLDTNLNEDVNANGVLDPTEDLNGNGILDTNLNEDVNGNGTLEPTNDATITITGDSVTDSQGSVLITIKYAKNTALWSTQLLTASINSNGTEFVETTSFNLPMAAADAASVDSSPPNIVSPYGVANACSNPD